MVTWKRFCFIPIGDFDFSFVPCDDEYGEDDSEKAPGDEKVGGPPGEYGEWESEADKVRPVGLEEGEALVERPPHLHPLVLETVQRVQQAHVQQEQRVRYVRQRRRREVDQERLNEVVMGIIFQLLVLIRWWFGYLNEEEGLDDEGEEVVGDEGAEGGDPLRAPHAVPVRQRSNVLQFISLRQRPGAEAAA
jgi:hypothetical protein